MNSLNEDCWNSLLSYISLRDVGQFAQVSKNMQKIIDNSKIKIGVVQKILQEQVLNPKYTVPIKQSEWRLLAPMLKENEITERLVWKFFTWSKEEDTLLKIIQTANTKTIRKDFVKTALMFLLKNIFYSKQSALKQELLLKTFYMSGC